MKPHDVPAARSEDFETPSLLSWRKHSRREGEGGVVCGGGGGGGGGRAGG